MPAPPATAPWDWLVALTFITSFFAAFGNGANDVANSFASSVAAKTLKMWHVGILAGIMEFLGAFALGERVTSTIKNGIIPPDNFLGNPAVFMLVMACAELANASWLMMATTFSMPVSTTQTIVGALVGVGIATLQPVAWGWQSGSVSQIAASWVVAPSISAVFGAALFSTIKYGILARKGEGEAFKWALRLIPFYFAFTGGILALFITIEAPLSEDLEDLGAGTAVGIVLGTFFGVLLIAYVFFKPYFERRLVREDARIQWYHIPLGPYLKKDDPWLYWPHKGENFVKNHYEDAYGVVTAGTKDAEKAEAAQAASGGLTTQASTGLPRRASTTRDDSPESSKLPEKDGSDREDRPGEDDEAARALKLQHDIEKEGIPETMKRKKVIQPYERFVGPVQHLSWANPLKWWGWIKFLLLRGVTMDVITHDSALLRSIHARAHRYDDRIEHLWTYCQVASACLSAIAHGSNDVANAIGPLVAVYETWRSGEVETETGTPVYILAMAGIALGLGFWFFGYNIMRAVGNRITQISPIRGFSIELGSSITVLMASRLGLPVSTTQCLVGATMGVALMNMDFKAVNWRQMAWIFFGWIITLPSAALLSGLLVVMAINTPRWDMPTPV